MTHLFFRLPPATLLIACVAAAAFATVLATVLALRSPQVDLPPDVSLLQVGEVTIEEMDRFSEPDQLAAYSRLGVFFERQAMIFAELSKSEISVTYATSDGSENTQMVTPRDRRVDDLPFAFWFQQGVGILAMLTAGWVLSSRRQDWGAAMFALTGFSLAISAMSASVYSTRQIAIDEGLFRIMSAWNHIGSVAFGIALVNLFLMYPRQLVRPIWLWVPFIFFSIGMALELLHIGEELWVFRIIALQLLLSILFGALQWWQGSRVDRTCMRWFFLFSLIGCSLFVGLSMAPPMLGLADQGYVDQAYAFGFFNLMHVGLALAVMRWRVFDLDRYAYYIWLWIIGAFLIFATDMILLLWLREQPWASLSIALVLGGFLYFPFRQFLLVRLFRSRAPKMAELMPFVLDTALAPTPHLKVSRWEQLLKDTFDPAAEIEHLQTQTDKATIVDNGAALIVPGPAGIGGRMLRYAAKGRRLFNSSDIKLAKSLVDMHRVVSESHLAYERGVNVERGRISRDVHDNIGAQLLSALHAAEGSRKDALLRDALTDLRQIISDGFRSDFRLTDIFADLRAEVGDRLEVHNIAFEWTEDDTDVWNRQRVPFLLVNTLRSVLREATSNIIKHAKADKVQVRLIHSGDSLEIEVADNGQGFDPNAVIRGEGLNNMNERVISQGGQISFKRKGETTIVYLSVPLTGRSSMMPEFANAAQ